MATRAGIWWARAKVLALGLSVAAGLAAVGAGVAQANTYTVNSTGDSGDANPGDGVCDIGAPTGTECTLRAAIGQARGNPGADTIDFSVTGEIALSNTPGRGGLVVGSGEVLTIDGPGAGVLAINGQDQVRPLTIEGGARVTIDGLTIKNGSVVNGADSGDGGGGIKNEGELVLNDSTVKDSSNSAVVDNRFGGGGIRNTGTLTLNRSTVSGNRGYPYGGGIYNAATGDLRISQSTVSSNDGPWGAGGIYNASPDFALIDSTVSGNTAFFGGGIYTNTYPNSVKAVQINNSTISGNTAATIGDRGNGPGGGIYAIGWTRIQYSTITDNDTTQASTCGNGVASAGSAGTVTEVGSTIISGNEGDWDVGVVNGSTNSFRSSGYNLIGGGCAIGAFGGPGDKPGFTIPYLGPLANNGGPTQTHALLPGSHAIDAASRQDFPATDQGGFARPKDGDGNGTSVADIGAYERQPRPPNDNFNRSQSISGASASVDGRTREATRETGEPDHLPNSGSTLGEHTVWYSWTSPFSGAVTFDTCASDFDTVVAAYTGGSIGSLTQTAADDDSCDGPNANGSRLTFNAVKGTTYRVAVSAYSASSQGTFTLKLREATPPRVVKATPPDLATGVSPSANVVAAFSERMSGGSINASTVLLRRTDRDLYVGSTVTYDARNRRAILNPRANLLPGVTYEVTVTPGARDVAGNALDQDPASSGNQAMTWTFTVGG